MVTNKLPVCQLGSGYPCQCSHIWLECHPVKIKKWFKRLSSRENNAETASCLNTRLQFILYLNAQQCCPHQTPNKRGDIHSGLFPHQVLLVRIRLTAKYKKEKFGCFEVGLRYFSYSVCEPQFGEIDLEALQYPDVNGAAAKHILEYVFVIITFFPYHQINCHSLTKKKTFYCTSQNRGVNCIFLP